MNYLFIKIIEWELNIPDITINQIEVIIEKDQGKEITIIMDIQIGQITGLDQIILDQTILDQIILDQTILDKI